MATLREIKGRIVSIASTRKITSAMKMISSAKLHKAQGVLKNASAYANALHRIMHALLTTDADEPLARTRAVRRIAIVVFASDNALCGAFNSNVIKQLQKSFRVCAEQHITSVLYAVGKKVFDAARADGLSVARYYEKLSGATAREPLNALADELAGMFIREEIDRVDLIYNRFKSVRTQQLVCEPLLPVAIPTADDNNDAAAPAAEYILEPDRNTLLQTIVPQSLRLSLYTALLHSNTSEHATRMIAMQTATDNADELIDELTIAYNKSRQQAITNELLDIVGGTANRQ